MPVLEDARRWVKDKLSHDEYIDGTPTEKFRQLQGVLPQLSQNERSQGIEHVRAYATYYYEGRHNEAVPTNVRQQLVSLQQRADRLNSVDTAREVLHRYGGPPSQTTITEALQRSEAERQRMRESVQQSEALKERNTPRESPINFMLRP